MKSYAPFQWIKGIVNCGPSAREEAAPARKSCSNSWEGVKRANKWNSVNLTSRWMPGNSSIISLWLFRSTIIENKPFVADNWLRLQYGVFSSSKT